MGEQMNTSNPMHSEHRRADSRYADKDQSTLYLHAGERMEKQNFRTSGTPIHNSTTYFYDSIQELDDVAYYRKPGY
jgi:O-acetylhomoserine/O-acetylserine sulfhydrylase-like pyridoxal-dependent enzyme